MRQLISDDELWEQFAQRALIRVAAEGADFGEVLATVEAVGSGGSHEWHAGRHGLGCCDDSAYALGTTPADWSE